MYFYTCLQDADGPMGKRFARQSHQCQQPSNGIYCSEHQAQRRCRHCNRHLRDELFVLQKYICDACDRKGRRQRGSGYTHSIKHTFARQEFSVCSDDVDVRETIKSRRQLIHDHLSNTLQDGSIKWQLSMGINFVREGPDGEARMHAGFLTTMEEMHPSTDIDLEISRAVDRLQKRVEDFCQMGSGWTIESIYELSVKTARFNPIGGSSYFPTPAKIANTKGVLNIKNDDELCFLWSVLAHLHPAKDNGCIVSKYLPYRNTLNVTGLTFPLPIHDIPKFEKLNDQISVNVLGLSEDGVVVPLRTTKIRGRQHHVNLLLLTKDVMVDGHSKTLYHYTLVKSLSRLLHSRTKCTPTM